MSYTIPPGTALKTCELNGGWSKKGAHEWTDYTPCLHFDVTSVLL